jgi:hypothetical protein
MQEEEKRRVRAWLVWLGSAAQEEEREVEKKGREGGEPHFWFAAVVW